MDATLTGTWTTVSQQLKVGSDSIGVFSACSDGTDGFFVLWHNTYEDEVQLQHFDSSGSFTWPQLIPVGVAGRVYSPILRSDGQGGVIACWQANLSGMGSYLYVQRVDALGNVTLSLEGVEPFTVAYFALRNQNPIFEFANWEQSLSYPYITISAPTVRDGEKLVGIGVVFGKHAAAWNGTLGSIDMLVSSNAPLELTADDFALVTGELLAASGEVLSVSMRERTTPRKFGNNLSQNYPNPFNPTTTISYSIANAGDVELTVFDVRGAVVRRWVKGERRPERYHVVRVGADTNGTKVASGVYFYRLRAPKFTMSRKMLLLR